MICIVIPLFKYKYINELYLCGSIGKCLERYLILKLVTSGVKSGKEWRG